jgi:hypothetical protein
MSTNTSPNPETRGTIFILTWKEGKQDRPRSWRGGKKKKTTAFCACMCNASFQGIQQLFTCVSN